MDKNEKLLRQLEKEKAEDWEELKKRLGITTISENSNKKQIVFINFYKFFTGYEEKVFVADSRNYCHPSRGRVCYFTTKTGRVGRYVDWR